MSGHITSGKLMLLASGMLSCPCGAKVKSSELYITLTY